MNTKQWRLAELIQTSTEFLKKNQIENARLNAEILLGQSLGMERVDLYLNYDRPLSSAELNDYRKLIRRRISREPLQYILGETEFMSLKFYVQPGTLIPRADTEILVERVIKTYRNSGEKWILDIGTGSGNISVSLAYYLPDVRIVGIDVSWDALKVAKKNIKKYSLENRVFLLHSDVTSSQFSSSFKGKFDCIVSNPPYIKEDELKELEPEVAKYEPQIALKDIGNNGCFYQKIAKFSKTLLKENGSVFVEFGINQGDNVRAIFKKNGYNNLETENDLAGIERILLAKKEDF
jgi:release factor glutamine methyltransferase